MPYERHDKDCIKKSPQPTKQSAADAYGNTFDNWCGDYIKHDVNNVQLKSGCLAPNQDAGKIPTDPYFKIIPLWQHYNYESTAPRPLEQYQHNVTVFDTYIPTVVTPFLVDESDVFIEIMVDGASYQLVSEDGYSLSYEPNTDIVLTNTYTVINTEDTGGTIETSSGNALATESYS